MPRHRRKRFIVMSGFQEAFLLEEVGTGKTEVAQSTQSLCLSFPLQCNDLALHEDRYFGNHSNGEFISKCYFYTESTSRNYNSPTIMYGNLKQTHADFESYVFKTTPVSYWNHINVDLEKKPEIEQSFRGLSVVREAKPADLREKTNDLHLDLESRGCCYHFSGLRLALLICLLRKLPWGSTWAQPDAI